MLRPHICLALLIAGCSSSTGDGGSEPVSNGGGGPAGPGGATGVGGSSAGTPGNADSGATATGGAATGGVATGGATGTGGTTPEVIGACDGLGPVGQWQEITPPDVPLNGYPDSTRSFVLDPLHTGIVYLGTCERGVYKTTDCGATWVKINTGTNGDVLDNSRQWTFLIDPVDPDVLYTNAGYYRQNGNKNGALKSTDGGVNWEWMWPPADGSLAHVVPYEFVAQMSMDPTDPHHLLIGFHGGALCAAPYNSVCYAESKDAGESWTMHNGDPRWGSSESQTPYVVKGGVWLFANHDSTGGLWVTSDSGQNWELIAPHTAGHWPGQLYQARTGYYLGHDTGMIRSVDGVTWEQIPNYTGSLVTGLAGDGTTMWASNYGAYMPWKPEGVNPYVGSSESDGLAWTPVPWTTPDGFMFTQGGILGYDASHHLLYSSNGSQGFWRVITK